jgi:hypothetical protein
MFQQLLHLVHAMRLVHAPIDKIEWALSGVYNRPLPTPNETITLNYPLPKGKRISTRSNARCLYTILRWKRRTYVCKV